MSSTDSERGDNILWEHGDSLFDDSICSPVFSKQATTPSSSQITTPGLNSPMDTITLSSQDSTVFFPTSGSSVPRKRGGRPSRKGIFRFRGNQHSEMTASSGVRILRLNLPVLYPLPTPKANLRFMVSSLLTSRTSDPHFLIRLFFSFSLFFFFSEEQKVTFKRAATTFTKCLYQKWRAVEGTGAITNLAFGIGKAL